MGNNEVMKNLFRYICLTSAVLAVLVICVACGPGPTSLRVMEERLFDEGVAPRMISYGDKLYYEGRLAGAHSAYLQAENQAYTDVMRKKARDRRIYVEQLIKAYQEGRPAPLPKQPKTAAKDDKKPVKAETVPPPPWVQPAGSAGSITLK